jgi:bidirectional [NiFe] hydrogenase diaphorase subunit
MREQTGADKRYRILAAHIKKHLARQDALIEVLHKAQELFGYLDDNTLRFVAWKLKLPASRVSGVATFYHYFRLKAQGAHTCVVCLGTACYVKGADEVLASAERTAGVKAGGTTADGKVSLFTARCIGACGIAPAVVFDGVVAPRQTAENTSERIQTWMTP